MERFENLHSVARSGQPLGVECICGRRVLLAQDKIGTHRGNMTELRELQKHLKCLGCGRRPKELRTFSTAEQARTGGPIADQLIRRQKTA